MFQEVYILKFYSNGKPEVQTATISVQIAGTVESYVAFVNEIETNYLPNGELISLFKIQGGEHAKENT